jgi:predicted nucleic acid-binding Zn ribbon protein
VPIYVYEVILEDGTTGETFEFLQQMADPPLTHHPDSGLPLRKVVSKPAIAGRWSDLKAQSNLSDKKLDAKGFTKYVKMGDGVYEKRAGQGPDVISADE